MTRWLLLGLLAAVGGGCAPALPPERIPAVCEVTEAAGILSGQTVWSGEILVRDDVVIPAGSRLVIRPGTLVRVRVAEGTKIEPEQLSPLSEILVRGELEVQGLAEAPVRFLPDGVEPSPGAAHWAGLILDGAGPARLRHAEIAGAEQALWLIASAPLVESCHLHDNRYGVLIQERSAPRLSDNLIERGEGGVYLWRDSHPVLTGNRILAHAEEGLFIDRSSRPTLGPNDIAGNGLGVAVGDPELDLGLLTLGDNLVPFRLLGSPAP